MLRPRQRLKGQEIVVVREVLEGMLAPSLAHAVLFDALDLLDDPPETADEWLRFAEGPLEKVIGERVGASEATLVSTRLAAILGNLGGSPPPRRRSREATGRFDRRSGPTRVLVMASTSRLARMLKAALGPSVVTLSVPDVPTYNDVVHDLEPSILLVDLTDPAAVPPANLKASLPQLPKHAIVLIWDEGTAKGEQLADALGGMGRPVAWVDRREGVEPLLDHIRAARAK